MRSPEELAILGATVWATNSRDGVVWRIDPETLDVKTVQVGGIPLDIAASEGGVYVTVRQR